jgi:hypothetical protein
MDRISPERVVEILKAHGTLVTLEEAKIILDFMYNFAEISLSQTLAYENSRSIHPGEHG